MSVGCELPLTVVVSCDVAQGVEDFEGGPDGLLRVTAERAQLTLRRWLPDDSHGEEDRQRRPFEGTDGLEGLGFG